MCFIITPTPTRAYQRLRTGESVIETFDELAKMITHYGSIALWTAFGWTAVKSAAFFFGSDLILSKKLNLA